MKNFFLSIILILFIIAFFSCKKDWSPGKGLSIAEAVYVSGGNYMSLSVKVNATLQLHAIITPGNDTVTNVSYSNKHPEISTIDNNGLLTGKTAGRDTLTVKSLENSDLTTSYILDVAK